jgi:hypothetical protein
MNNNEFNHGESAVFEPHRESVTNEQVLALVDPIATYPQRVLELAIAEKYPAWTGWTGALVDRLAMTGLIEQTVIDRKIHVRRI